MGSFPAIAALVRGGGLVEAHHLAVHVDHHLESRHAHERPPFFGDASFQERVELLVVDE